MDHLPFKKLLMYQTLIVSEFGMYLDDEDYLPIAHDFFALQKLHHRLRDARMLCAHLEIELRERYTKGRT